jgi:hypothetical protein
MFGTRVTHGKSFYSLLLYFRHPHIYLILNCDAELGCKPTAVEEMMPALLHILRVRSIAMDAHF